MPKKSAYTPEQLDHIEKCKKSPKYFIENFLYIQAPSKGVFKFHLYPFQAQLIDELLGENFIEKFKNGEVDIEKFQNIVKSRGMGVSTLMAAISLYLITFVTGFNIAIIATDLDTAQSLYKKIDLMYENLPKFLKHIQRKRTQKELVLKNQSSVKCYAHSKSKGVRSLHASWIIIDEAHFIEGMEKLWETVEPAVDHGVKCIALSSPDYTEGWFYEIFLNSLKDDDDEDKIWSLIELPWYLHPDRQLEDGSPNYKWRRRKDVQHGKRKASKEYDAKFSFSEDVFFSPEDLEYIENNMVKEPKYKSRRLWVWKKPEKGFTYMVTVDCAEGGKDNNHINVFCVETLEQVAEYVSKENYLKFGYMPAKIGKLYNNALVIIEKNSVGTAIIQRTIELEYDNIYMRNTGKDKKYSDEKKADYGVRTTTKTRPKFIGALQSLIETEENEDKIIIRSNRLMQELKTFVDKSGKPQAKTGRTDDGIMSMSFFAYIYSIGSYAVNSKENTDDFLSIVKSLNNTYDNVPRHKTVRDELNENYNKNKQAFLLRNTEKDFKKKSRLHKSFGINTHESLNYSEWKN